MLSDQNSIRPIAIIAGSLAFVGGSAFNDAFKSLFDKYLGTRNAVIAKFIYAIILTIIIIISIKLIFYLDSAVENKIDNYIKN